MPDLPIAQSSHDHGDCTAQALAAAERLCADRGLRLTPLRRQVLELVWASHRPRGAYEVLQMLTERRGPAAPPTIYRALEFLLAQGLIHRIESLNAYIGCPDPEREHSTQFFICEGCGAAAELAGGAIDRAIDREAASLGFAVAQRTVELRGTCSRCQARPPSAPT